MYLSIPEMGSYVIGTVAELDGQDLMHILGFCVRRSIWVPDQGLHWYDIGSTDTLGST